MQPGFFDQEDRLARLEKLGDPLPRPDSIVDWRAFRPLLQVIHQKQRNSGAGRKPHDVTLMFKMLVLQSLYSSPFHPQHHMGARVIPNQALCVFPARPASEKTARAATPYQRTASSGSRFLRSVGAPRMIG